MNKKICKPGEVIFREGDESTEAYWITSGRVEITIRAGVGGLPVARLGPGEIIGEMGLIDNKPRSATATSMGVTELEVITEEAFENDVLMQPARLRTFLGRMFERLRATDTLLELERAKPRASAAAAAVSPATPSQSATECGPEPVVTVKSVVPNPVTSQAVSVDVDRFPFRIGRAGGTWSTFFQNELSIDDANPLQVSRQHASIDHCGGGKCFLTDRGSRMGTVVNGVRLSVGSGTLVAELKEGDNTVIFGHPDISKHRYTIKVAPGR
jgi:CRP-like cAMP-binding protein